MRLKSVVVFILAAALVTPQSLPAQQAAPPAGNLKIIVLQGESARNSIKGKTAVAPVVEVRDENDKPVEGAEVVFQLPAAGPGGIFHGWMRSQTQRTNAQGQAGASGYVPNDQEGRFNIKATATKENKTGSIVIAQINSSTGAEARSKKSGWWVVLAVAGAGALAGGVVAATRNGNSTTVASQNPVTITPGVISVSGPK